jgi:hypothetical protein
MKIIEMCLRVELPGLLKFLRLLLTVGAFGVSIFLGFAKLGASLGHLNRLNCRLISIPSCQILRLESVSPVEEMELTC